MFPDTDSSQTIIDCFLTAARNAGVILKTGTAIKDLVIEDEGSFRIDLDNGTGIRADKVCVTSGSLKSSPLTRAIGSLGHSVEPLVPSLFASDVSDPLLEGLAGLSVQNASVKTIPKSPPQTGPVLITHRGFSGPAILRLSAWEARTLQAQDYRFGISINWLGNTRPEELRSTFASFRAESGKALVKNRIPGEIPLPPLGAAR